MFTSTVGCWPVAGRLKFWLSGYVVGEEAAIAKVEATALNSTSIVHALCVVCGGIASEAACGEFGPGTVDVTRPLIVVENSTTDKASGFEEVL